MLKHVHAALHAACADDLDFGLQPLAEGKHIRQRGGLQIRAADAAQAVFGLNQHRFAVRVHQQAVADAVHRIDIRQRIAVQNRRHLVKMHQIKIRRQLHAQGQARELREHGIQHARHGFKVVARLRFADHVGAG